MKVESVILELYNDAVSRAELIAPKSREYIEALDKKSDAEKRLKDSLSESQIEDFEQFLSDFQKVQTIEEGEIYRSGVSLGVRLTAESFLMSSDSEGE